MKKTPILNRFLPYGESKISINEFLFNTAVHGRASTYQHFHKSWGKPRPSHLRLQPPESISEGKVRLQRNSLSQGRHRSLYGTRHSPEHRLLLRRRLGLQVLPPGLGESPLVLLLAGRVNRVRWPLPTRTRPDLPVPIPGSAQTNSIAPSEAAPNF